MTRIYLDVRDRVCVDKTQAGEHAARAFVARSLTDLCTRLEHASRRTIALRKAKGLSNASARLNLDQIRRARAQLRADAS